MFLLHHDRVIGKDDAARIIQRLPALNACIWHSEENQGLCRT